MKSRRRVNSAVRCLASFSSMTFNYPEAINALSPEQKLHFYELLAHNLTVTNRAIFNAQDLPDAEKLNRLKLINEIQHRVTSKIYVTRLNLHEWTETDAWQMIGDYVAQDTTIESEVNFAIRL